MVIYLSPSHYHRIHSPLSGSVTERFVLGRKSYPVNAAGMEYGKNRCQNYRSVTEISSDGEHMALVKVGAMFVNSIELLQRDTVQKGEEMAYLHLVQQLCYCLKRYDRSSAGIKEWTRASSW